MELSKLLDGFIDADTLIIKAQFLVIRERADLSFRCLDCQYRGDLYGPDKAKKSKGKYLEAEDLPIPVVRTEKDSFDLVVDVLLLLERAAMEPLARKDEKGPQIRTKELDWGWKKFMELSKLLDGFIDADTLIITAQVLVIRERADLSFRCLDCQYRRELVRVYLTNVEQICQHFVEERRAKLGELIEDKVRRSSFCAFWLGMDQSSRRCMSREKTEWIVKVFVKRVFIEKEITSTLVIDSLYSGLKALEGQIRRRRARASI
ncbi:TNF receptor-associated factor1b [Sesamum alatum]|uniref:TNF receptor-associated factor1b n=1 Tax=Sesamum alatum TaxID=300844 RepID=A0AAE1Y1M2_9LAMI|nr:TNF receptor-associated factor1b [Sesamum alatum]